MYGGDVPNKRGGFTGYDSRQARKAPYNLDASLFLIHRPAKNYLEEKLEKKKEALMKHGKSDRYCIDNSLDANLVKGKIVFCDQISTGSGPFLANATGAIMSDYYYADFAFDFPLPAAFFTHDVGAEIFKYLNATRFYHLLLLRLDF